MRTSKTNRDRLPLQNQFTAPAFGGGPSAKLNSMLARSSDVAQLISVRLAVEPDGGISSVFR
jgi:hypothetical protein